MADDVREVLLAKQQELQDRSADLTAPPDSSGSISFGKRVGDGTSMAVERITQVAAHEQLLWQAEEVARAHRHAHRRGGGVSLATGFTRAFAFLRRTGVG